MHSRRAGDLLGPNLAQVCKYVIDDPGGQLLDARPVAFLGKREGQIEAEESRPARDAVQVDEQLGKLVEDVPRESKDLFDG